MENQSDVETEIAAKRARIVVLVKFTLLVVLFLWVCYALFLIGAHTGSKGNVQLAFLASSFSWTVIFVGIIAVELRKEEIWSPITISMKVGPMWMTFSAMAALITNTLVLRLICWMAKIPFPEVF